MGDINDFNPAISFGVQGHVPMENERLLIGGGLAYYKFKYENFEEINFSAIPIVASAQYLLTGGKINPFIGSNLGIIIFNSEYDDDTQFLFAPCAGFDVVITDNATFNLNGILNLTSDANHFGINAGVRLFL
jgi:hypothetical protein